jgi:hypothetical protein
MLYNCATVQEMQSTLCVHLMVAKSQKALFVYRSKTNKNRDCKKTGPGHGDFIS